MRPYIVVSAPEIRSESVIRNHQADTALVKGVRAFFEFAGVSATYATYTFYAAFAQGVLKKTFGQQNSSGKRTVFSL